MRTRSPVDLAEVRFARSVCRLHDLGSRVLCEFLVELGRQTLIRTDLELRVARYAALDPVVLRALAADQWPPTL